MRVLHPCSSNNRPVPVITSTTKIQAAVLGRPENGLSGGASNNASTKVRKLVADIRKDDLIVRDPQQLRALHHPPRNLLLYRSERRPPSLCHKEVRRYRRT